MIRFKTSTQSYSLTVKEAIDFAKTWKEIVFDIVDTGICISDTVTLWINPVTATVSVEELLSDDEIVTIPSYMTDTDREKLLDWEECCYIYRQKYKVV